MPKRKAYHEVVWVSPQKIKSLYAVVEEEASIVEPGDGVSKTLCNDLSRVSRKLATVLQKGANLLYLTKGERAAIDYALQDVGDLYRFAGTSAGFDMQDEDNPKNAIRRARYLGNAAGKQAFKLGIIKGKEGG